MPNIAKGTANKSNIESILECSIKKAIIKPIIIAGNVIDIRKADLDFLLVGSEVFGVISQVGQKFEFSGISLPHLPHFILIAPLLSANKQQASILILHFINRLT